MNEDRAYGVIVWALVCLIGYAAGSLVSLWFLAFGMTGWGLIVPPLVGLIGGLWINRTILRD